MSMILSVIHDPLSPIHDLMKSITFPSLVAFAALRFKFLSSASTVIERRYSLRETPPRLPHLRVSLRPKSPLRLLCVLSGFALTSSGFASTTWNGPTWNVTTAIPISGGAVTGTYQPDGRATDPLTVLNTDARPAMLADFIGLDPNGNWTLFVADQNPGDTSTLQSWTLTIKAVPEPSAALLSLLGAVLLLRRSRP